MQLRSLIQDLASPGAQLMLAKQLLAMAVAVISRFAALALLMVAALLLPADEFGLFAVLSIFSNALVAVVAGGSDMWLNRFTRESESRNPQLSPMAWQYLRLALLLAGIVLIVALLFASVGRSAFNNNGLLIAAALLNAVCAGFGDAVFAVLRSRSRVVQFFLLRDAAAPLAIILAVVLVHPDRAIDIFLISSTIWALVIAAAFLRLGWHDERGLQFSRLLRARHLNAILRHTGPLLANNLVARFTSYIDVLMLTMLLPIAAAGEYRLTAQFAIGFGVVQHFIFLALPWQLRHAGDHGRAGAGFVELHARQHWLLLIAGPTLLVLLFAAAPILGLFGERFVEWSRVLQLLMIVRFAALFWGPQHELLISNGHPWRDTLAGFIAAFAWLLVFALLATPFGSVPAAVSATAASVLVAESTRAFMLQRTGIPRPAQGFGAVLVPVLLIAAVGCIAPAFLSASG